MYQLSAHRLSVGAETSTDETVTVDSAFTNNAAFRYEWPSYSAFGGQCDQLSVTLMAPDGTVIGSRNMSNYIKTNTSIDIHASSKLVKANMQLS